MTAPVYGLTPAQADCARVIAAMTDFLGNSPSYDEIAAELSLASAAGVHRLVHGLIDRGWIEWPFSPTLVPARFSLPRRGLKLTRSPPPFPMCAIAITEAGRAYLEKVA